MSAAGAEMLGYDSLEVRRDVFLLPENYNITIYFYNLITGKIANPSLLSLVPLSVKKYNHIRRHTLFAMIGFIGYSSRLMRESPLNQALTLLNGVLAWDPTIDLFFSMPAVFLRVYSLLNKVENAHSDPIYCCAWAKVKINQDSMVNDNYVVTGGLDGLVKVWNVNNNKLELLHTLHEHAMAVVSVAVSSKGLVIASASLDSIIILWDLPKCKKIKQINTDTTDSWQIAFSPDANFIVSGRHNGNLTVYNVENNSIEAEIDSRGKFLLSVAWSDNGKHIACGSVDGNVHIFDAIQRKLLHTLNAHTETVRSVNFSPSSKLLASGSTDGYVKIFNTYNMNTVCSLKLDSWVMSVCFSPDDSRVAIATGDGAVTIALAADLKVLKTFQEHTGKVCDVKFSSDGTKLISVAKDNSINIYECQTPLKK